MSLVDDLRPEKLKTSDRLIKDVEEGLNRLKNTSERRVLLKTEILELITTTLINEVKSKAYWDGSFYYSGFSLNASEQNKKKIDQTIREIEELLEEIVKGDSSNEI
jgi:hypothetical protein